MKKFYLLECGAFKSNNYQPYIVNMYDDLQKAKLEAKNFFEENRLAMPIKGSNIYCIIIEQEWSDDSTIINYMPYIIINSGFEEAEILYGGKLVYGEILDTKFKSNKITKKQYETFVNEVIMGTI